MITLTPAFGRDYKSFKAALADYDKGMDFILNDWESRWNGLPINKQDVDGNYMQNVFLRYNKLRNVKEIPS